MTVTYVFDLADIKFVVSVALFLFLAVYIARS